jgi:PhnB protein
MPAVNPYLNFKGNCEEAFNYYKSVFGGEFAYIGKFSDMPPQEGVTLTEEDKNKIMHVSLPLSNGSLLMGSDSGGEWAPDTVIGNNISLSLSLDTKEEADKLFNALADGGKVTMPMSHTFWGDYFGMCTDKFGINWMFSFNENMQKK